MLDTPKRTVSWLERFPPDIWAYFVCYLSGEQLGRLMITGATLLWQRLKSPKVVKSIKLGTDFIVFKSYPRFLNSFPSLMELSIDSPRTEWSDSLDLRLDSLPSSLRKLELSGSARLADSLFGENITALKLDEYLPRLETLLLPRLNFRSYSWMTHSPPSLTTLSIIHWDGTVELPSSLIHFEAERVILENSSFVSKLPPSLESFVVRRKLDRIDLVVPIPLSCRKLSLGQIGGVESLQNLFEQLPKFLTSFSVPSSLYLHDLDYGEYSKLASLMPPTLTELDMFPSGEWLTFPGSLTKLSFLSNCLLSRSLCIPPETSKQSFFPPQLTYLDIPQGQLSLKAAKLLPPSLTHLEIGNFCERVCEHIPKGLKTLISYRTLMSPNLIKFLPTSLTCLRLSILSGDFREWYDCDTGQSIDPISKLPEYPIHELSVSNFFAWQIYSPLPFSLEILEIDDTEGIGDSFLEHQQLSNLLILNMPDSKHVTNDSIPLLSPRLTTLNLASCSSISGKSFEFLPRNLTELVLRRTESIFDSDIQYLPRTLTDVCLDHAVHLTDLSVADLPPHLENLCIKFNSKITPSSLPHLPYSLRSTQFSHSVEFFLWGIRWGEMYHE